MWHRRGGREAAWVAGLIEGAAWGRKFGLGSLLLLLSVLSLFFLGSISSLPVSSLSQIAGNTG